jgi:hypothetical protein
MGAGNQVGIGLSYTGPPRFNIDWRNRFLESILGLIKILKFGLRQRRRGERNRVKRKGEY